MNTVHEQGIKLSDAEHSMIERGAKSLENKIRNYFLEHPDFDCTYTELIKLIPTNLTQISYQRSLTNLVTERFLVKTDEKRMGNHRVFIHVYKRNRVVEGSLPVGYVSPKNELPNNGESVMVITDTGRSALARFETFLGNEVWETNYGTEDHEMVVGWKRQ